MDPGAVYKLLAVDGAPRDRMGFGRPLSRVNFSHFAEVGHVDAINRLRKHEHVGLLETVAVAIDLQVDMEDGAEPVQQLRNGEYFLVGFGAAVARAGLRAVLVEYDLEQAQDGFVDYWVRADGHLHIWDHLPLQFRHSFSDDSQVLQAAVLLAGDGAADVRQDLLIKEDGLDELAVVLLGGVDLEAQLEQLVVEDPEDADGAGQLLDHPAAVLQVVFEKFRQLFGVGE